jgi:hypothetical protein
MHSLLVAIYSYFLNPILTLLLFLIFAYVIMSWLVVGGVLSMRNPTVRQIQYVLDSVMLPLLRRSSATCRRSASWTCRSSCSRLASCSRATGCCR